MSTLTPEQKAAVVAMMESFTGEDVQLTQENASMGTKLSNIGYSLEEFDHFLQHQIETIKLTIESLKKQNMTQLLTISEAQLVVLTAIRENLISSFKNNNLDYEELVAF